MKRFSVLSILIVLSMVLAACAPAATPVPASPTTAPTAMVEPTATTAPEATKAPTATTAPTATKAPTATTEPTMVPNTIVDVAVADGRFKTLAAALTAAGLVDALKADGPFTVFAPTDDAFAKLPAGTLETLLKPENKQKLTDILLYHVVPGKLMAADVVKLADAQTLQGARVPFKVDGDKVMVGTATVVLTDVAASNGVIHVIDSVILPPEAAAPTKDIVDIAAGDARFKTLVAGVKAAGLVDTLKSAGPFTVFAPTDDAFAALPAGTLESLLKPENLKKLTDVLTYHVLPGAMSPAALYLGMEEKTVQGTTLKITAKDGNLYINDAKVLIAAIPAANGVIYAIDKVILPADSMAAAPTKDIVDVAVADGRFKTLAAALTAAGLVDTLKGAGPFTVFAPTDAAFAKLPAGTLESLLKPENKQKLTDILTYHVVSGKVMAADVMKLSEAKTVNGQSVTVKVMDGKVYINDAQVILADVPAANGVIHVIDTVLLPK